MLPKYEYIENILEILKGKTVLESISIRGYDLKSLDIYKKKSLLETTPNKEIIIHVPFNFIDYALWNYYETYFENCLDTKEVNSIALNIRNIFKKEDEYFQILISDTGIELIGRNNIEDTLLLDLERFFNSKEIDYKVN